MSNDNSQEAASSVLIVDGDVISCHVIADYLRHCGYAAVEAANTKEAFVPGSVGS